MKQRRQLRNMFNFLSRINVRSLKRWNEREFDRKKIAAKTSWRDHRDLKLLVT